jgi:hypothetical protein
MSSALKGFLWQWTLRRLRTIVWAADEWVHAQELKLRESAAAVAPVAPPAEFNRQDSAVREKAHKRAARGLRGGRPRLIYHGGQFMRKEGN